MRNSVEADQKLVEHLNGTWQFSLDPDNNQQWYKESTNLPQDIIQVPSSWEEAGYGKYTDHQPISTWKKDKEYEGVAWYVKDVTVPSSYDGLQVLLHLKGVRGLSTLWIDGEFVGEDESLITPHCFDISNHIQPGKSQRFVIQLDTQIKYSLHESHIHSYHTATNWGGITGGIEIEGVLPDSFMDIHIQPNTQNKSVDLRIKINNNQTRDSHRVLMVEALQSDGKIVCKKTRELESVIEVGKEEYKHVNRVNSLQINEQFTEESFTIGLGEHAKLWSPEQPYLYQLKLTLIQNNKQYAQKIIPFGLREIQTAHRQILLNGEPIFLTGYVDCCIFPQTGYPVWDKDHYKRQFQIVKEYGFNHVRLHGWTPPKPFFEAADEEGMLVQTELPHWGLAYRNRRKNAPEDVHQFLKSELERVIKLLHTHPSFVMFSLGNELIGIEGHPQLNELIRYAKALDSTRLYTDNTGFGELPAQDREGDFFTPTMNHHPPYHIDDAAHPDTTQDFREITRLEEKPMIAHEHGQFTTYVRPREAEKYHGILKPNWLETINETLQLKGLENRIDEFIEATSIHMKRTLKEAMEKARRTPGLSGIQLLDVRDFPGQGHATVGVLDVFWDDKNIIFPQEFRNFNDQTVLLMRSTRRTYYMDELFRANIEVSHFGKQVTDAQLTWTLADDQGVFQQETLTIQEIHNGGLTNLVDITFAIPDGETRQIVLTAQLQVNGRTYTNKWSFWVFKRAKLHTMPERIWTNVSALRSIIYGTRIEKVIGIKQISYQKETDVDLAITSQLSRDVLQYLIDGGSVLLLAQADNQYDEVFTKYSPIFWNYLLFPEQTGTTMGMKIHSHPALDNFPHDGFTNWHWYHLIHHTVALNLESIPNVQPIIEVIDNFNRAKRLAYAFEVRVGKGKLFVSSLHVTDREVMKLPETQWFFIELINYLTSDKFQPKETISMGELLGIFKLKAPLINI